MKLYDCELCDRKVQIRSTIKSGENKGLKVCPICASKFRDKKTSDKTRRTQKARKEQRKDYPEIFQKHIEVIKNKKLRCEECGKLLRGNSTEVAHIISKSNNPECATDDNNVLYLCSEHHGQYDQSLKEREKMKVMSIALERYKKLKFKNISSEVLFYENVR